MEKFIPYEKLSKKEKRKIDQARRQTWGELNPITRKPATSKAYNRKKSQAWKRELPPTACDFFDYFFAVFLVNDLYGFISWKRMEKRQLNMA